MDDRSMDHVVFNKIKEKSECDDALVLRLAQIQFTVPYHKHLGRRQQSKC